jgi:hypothetical protein
MIKKEKDSGKKKIVVRKITILTFVKKLLTPFRYLPLSVTLLTTYHLSLTTDVHAAFRKSVGTSGAQFLKLGVNARAIAMGEAYGAVVDGSDAIYWNPAGLERVKKGSLSLMHAVYLDNIYYDFASYAQRAGVVGTVGVGVQYLSASSIDQTNEFGTTIGSFKPYDLAVSLGWAKTLKDFGDTDTEFVLGLTGKFIQSKIIETANAGAVDLGINWNALEKCWLSVSIHNLGTAIKFKEESDDLPVNVRVGSSYQVTDSFLMSLDGNVPRDNNPNIALGTEYKAFIGQSSWFAMRAGYNSRTMQDIHKGMSGISAGGGLGLGGTGIDFAWVPFGQFGHTYRVSLSIKF